MRYRLRTLLIVLALIPATIYVAWMVFNVLAVTAEIEATSP